MPLSPQDRLGAYEIVAKLGEGGMGEVYRAKDTNLGREVAIKVLPADVARDAERLARFKREAQLLASLNAAGAWTSAPTSGRSGPCSTKCSPASSSSTERRCRTCSRRC